VQMESRVLKLVLPWVRCELKTPKAKDVVDITFSSGVKPVMACIMWAWGRLALTSFARSITCMFCRQKNESKRSSSFSIWRFSFPKNRFSSSSFKSSTGKKGEEFNRFGRGLRKPDGVLISNFSNRPGKLNKSNSEVGSRWFG